MPLSEFNILKNLWVALKEFIREDGLDKSSVLAYYSIFSSLFLLTFFTFLFTRFLGNPELAFKSIYPFSPDFFSKISPEIFQKASEISAKLREIGVIGISLSLILGFLVIKKIVQYVNLMFMVDLKTKRREKGFLVRRVSEFSLLFLMGFLVVVSFMFSGMISTLSSLFTKNQFVANYINPQFIETLNTFLVVYIVPSLITFCFFFVLYKWIPEKIVYVKGALVSAVISTILWELIKRTYAYYLVNISIIGQIKGPIIAIILFGFWMEFSMGVMLYGAKLTYIFDRQHDAKSILKKRKESQKTTRKKSKSEKKNENEDTHAEFERVIQPC